VADLDPPPPLNEEVWCRHSIVGSWRPRNNLLQKANTHDTYKWELSGWIGGTTPQLFVVTSR
jgi:hypothetical protein